MDRKNRRSHAKSRRGCMTCKRRHVKCDESRPACINCLTAHRRCPYLDDGGVSREATPSNQSENTKATTSGNSPSFDAPAPPFTILKVENQGQALLEVELLQQWLTSTCHTCLGQNARASFFAATAVNTGLRYPLVMNSLLAFSALHLSWSMPERRGHLLQDIEYFEKQGIMAFRDLNLVADPKLVIPCLLFSFITGVHRLCYVLAYCNTDVDDYLSSLTECISLLRGVSVVVTGNMDVVRNSELGPLLIPAETRDANVRRSTDLEAIDELDKICNVGRIKKEDSAVLSAAIEALRTLYEEPDDSSNYGIGSVTIWMMKAPSGLIDLLNDRQPQALIVLAHAAPLLYRRRRCWAVGNSAAFLVESVRGRITPEWQQWLTWPEQAIL